MGMNASRLAPRHTGKCGVVNTACAELRPYQKCTKKPRIEGKGLICERKQMPRLPGNQRKGERY